ncbi:MAG: hypothetical protein ABSE40_22485 [Candidatus Sulfotelmatobacter sp.]
MLFALAICGDPDLLFLDEPTVGLDVEARRLLWDEIRQLKFRMTAAAVPASKAMACAACASVFRCWAVRWTVSAMTGRPSPSRCPSRRLRRKTKAARLESAGQRRAQIDPHGSRRGSGHGSRCAGRVARNRRRHLSRRSGAQRQRGARSRTCAQARRLHHRH